MRDVSHLPLFLAVICALFWVYFCVPVVSRLFGLRVPFGYQKRRKQFQQLSFARYFLLQGMMSFGMPLFVYLVANAFFEWRLSVAWKLGFTPSFFSSSWGIPFVGATCAIAAALYTSFTWRPKQADTKFNG